MKCQGFGTTPETAPRFRSEESALPIADASDSTPPPSTTDPEEDTSSKLTNNVLSSAQQLWLQKLGGARNPVKEYIDKLGRDESTGTYEPADKSEALPKDGKPQLGQVAKPSDPQRGGRFKKLMEEESRRKQLLEQAKQTEQVGIESDTRNGKQSSDGSAADSKDEEESHENEPISASSNGRLSHATNETTPERNTGEGTIPKETDTDSNPSVSDPASPTDDELRHQENGNDAV